MGMLSCSKSDSEETQVESPATITSVSKLSGEANTEITISGTNFGLNPNAIQVFFNGKLAAFKIVTKDLLSVYVPSGASTGNIKIVKNGTEITGPVFEYILGHNTVSTVAAQVFPTGINTPSGIVVDANGNIYVSCIFSRQIKKIDKNGVVTDFAGIYSQSGYVDGISSIARFKRIETLAVDSKGNVYATDFDNSAVRKITPEGVVSTLAGLVALNGSPVGIAVDKQDNVFITTGLKIMKITPDGTVSVFAGSNTSGSTDGTGINASFYGALRLTIDANDNLYVLETGNEQIRKITPQGVVSTIKVTTIQNGVAKPYLDLDIAHHISIDKSNNLYVSTGYNISNILKIAPDGSARFIFTGKTGGYQDGAIDQALIWQPAGIAFDKDDNLYFIEGESSINVRKIAKEKP